MNIVFLITAMSEFTCGVKDYTFHVTDALRRKGVDVVIEHCETWSWKAVFDFGKKYRRKDNIVFHLQYPTFGIGNSIAPAILPLRLFFAPFYVTLHEFSVFHFFRKIIFLTHSFLATQIIFTNEFERGQFLQFFPWAKRRTEIIPIGSNITLKKTDLARNVSKQRLIYFGQISERKGIEFFIEAAKIIRDKNLDIDIVMIGSISSKQAAFVHFVEDAVKRYNIELLLALPEDQVSRELQKSTMALLPFPDGITEKRGSALACLTHGNVVMSVHSKKTPLWLKKVTYAVHTANDAAEHVEKILTGRDDFVPDLPLLHTELALRSWDNIAQMHLALYRKG